MKKLSVVYATFNEQRNIGESIKSIKEIADEIIVFDESSWDKTRDIAEKFGAKVFKVKHEPIFHVTKQKAIDKANGDWVLQLDADERLTDALRKEIIKVINKDSKFSAYYIKRKNYFLGKWMRGSGMWPDSVVRLFVKGKAHLPQKSVHEQMKVEGEIGILENPMEHLTAPTFSKYLTNANRYTTLTALELEGKNIPINPWSFLVWMILKPIYTFIVLFIRHKGFIDGFHGFIFDLFSGLHFSLAFLKYWQLKKDPKVKSKLISWK